MREISQLQRSIKILQILSSGRKITTSELHRRFGGEVSIRTLQRDLLSLLDAGIPLITEKIKANQNLWSLMEEFKSFIPFPLETNEYLAAHILKSNLKIFQKTPFEKEIQSLIKKIGQIVPEEVFLEIELDNSTNLFENYTSGIFDYSPHGEVISCLISSVLHRKRCVVTYHNPYSRKEKTYPIEPEKLIYYNGGLYLIAYIRKYGKFRLLAIQRIKKLDIKDDRFPKDHHFNSKLFFKNKFGLFSSDPVAVELEFLKEVCHNINGRSWHHSQKFIEKKDGNIILSMTVGLSPELISWIMGWHQNVIVKSPNKLIKIIKTLHVKTLEMYK